MSYKSRKKIIRDNVVATFVSTSVVIVPLPHDQCGRQHIMPHLDFLRHGHVPPKMFSIRAGFARNPIDGRKRVPGL